MNIEDMALADNCNFDATDSKYRKFSKTAKDVLSAQMTTVAFESTFITRGHVIDGTSRLSPSTIKALICTSNWVRGIDPLENLM